MKKVYLADDFLKDKKFLDRFETIPTLDELHMVLKSVVKKNNSLDYSECANMISEKLLERRSRFNEAL